jgi:hypothetical protein
MFVSLGTFDNAPIDDDDARLCFARTMAWPRLGFSLSAMPDELAVVLARAITRHSWSSPLMFGCRRRGAAANRVHPERHRRVFRVDGRMPTMTCTAVAVQQTVDRTPRAAFNRPI